MVVTLVGMGLGTAATMTAEGLSALREADLLIGSARLLGELPSGDTCPHHSTTKPQEIVKLLVASSAERPCVLYSGDTGFYSGARSLLPMLAAEDIPTVVLPGLSSVQYFAARLGRPWQDWMLCSSHGVNCDPVAAVCGGKEVFFVTGGTLVPGELCRQLTEAGLGTLAVTVGENLTHDSEKILSGCAADFAGQTFPSLSVLLVQPAPKPYNRVVPGIPDGEFIRGNTPMTKQEVRSVIIAKLGVTAADVCWDIGAGTGSVSVELALQAGATWAVEYKQEACELIRSNRIRFGAWKLRLVEGRAAEVLDKLPRPDAVFVGGSEGDLAPVLQAAYSLNPDCRVCVSAVTLETLHSAVETFTAMGREAQVTQLAVTRAKPMGSHHLMLAENPIYLIVGEKNG